MRKIKFRAKRSDDGKWVFGDLTHEYRITREKDIPCIRVARYNIDESSIGQFTGITDKNGKEIYFDDIVRNKYGDIGSVIWFSDWTLRVDWGGGDIHFIDPEWGLEVIGNIHDNPELLK